MALSWRFGAYSDIGRSRRKNDDSGYAGPHLIVVADGMGGAPAGDLASAVAVQTLERLDAPPPDDLLEALAGTLHRANDRLAEIIEQDTTVAGMGTTVTAALFDGRRIGVAHLGDSRGYLWRDGELLRLTTDHTWVQSLIDDGRISDEEAKVHSHRSLLLKVLDGQHDHDPDLAVYDVRAGDRVLLCSDGLSGFVAADRIERALAVGTADSVAVELTRLALEAGSNDNVTAVVADIVDTETGAASPLLVGAVAAPPRGAVGRLRNWAQRDDARAGKSLMADPDVDPEELRYAPREPHRFSGLRRLATLLVLVAVVAAAGVAAYRWSQEQYYVAASGHQVAIYRGVQAELPGLKLHSVYLMQDLRLSELPTFRRSQVIEGLPADNLGHARRIVDNLRSFARSCATQASHSSSPSTVGTSTTPNATTLRTPSTPPQTPTTAAPRRPRKTSTASHRPTQSPSRLLATGAGAPEECAGATPSTPAPPSYTGTGSQATATASTTTASPR